MTLLAVRGLTKHFPVRGEGPWRPKRKVHAVDDVSFTVERGETLGVVGESGCGKSTTARLIARLIDPDRGSLIYDGEGVAEYRGMAMREYRRRLQMVFQDSFASLNPHLTAEDTIAFGPRVHGVPGSEARARARQLLARVGLEPRQFGARYPHELSGGQRQRVNIARALAFEPQLLILDEAVAALDKSVQAQVLNLLQELKAERALTYVLISHDLNVIEYVSDRVLVMYLGEVVETGSAEALAQAPKHPYTQALFASAPSMDPDRRMDRLPITGDPPNPIDPPSGCRFRTRCPFAMPRCAETPPPLVPVSATHEVACYLYEEGLVEATR